jgi:hypothetical protein
MDYKLKYMASCMEEEASRARTQMALTEDRVEFLILQMKAEVWERAAEMVRESLRS